MLVWKVAADDQAAKLVLCDRASELSTVETNIGGGRWQKSGLLWMGCLVGS